VNGYLYDGLPACILPEFTVFQPELEQTGPQSLSILTLHRYASPLGYQAEDSGTWNLDQEGLPLAGFSSTDGKYIIDR
jgi:hypothetical protein